MQDIKELIELSEANLLKELVEAEKELYVLSIRALAQEEKKVHLISKHKKYIARIKTVLKQKQLADIVN